MSTLRWRKFVASFFLIGGLMSCEAALGSETGLSNHEVDAILQGQHIEGVWTVSQEVQDPNSVLLFVKANRRAAASLCLVDFHTLDVRKSDKEKWQVKGVEAGVALSLAPCAKAVEENFANVEAGSPIDGVIQCAVDINAFLASGISGEATVEFRPVNLKKFVGPSLKDSMVSIKRTPGGQYEGQFAVRGVMPQLLGIRTMYSGGKLARILVNTENGIDPAQP